MTLGKLLRFSSPAIEGPERAGNLQPSATCPYDNPMLLGVPQGEFTPNVRRAIWALLGEARNLKSELERTRVLLRSAEQAVDRDHLLPILNRRAFVRELGRQIASASRYETPVSLAYIDIDGLKLTNDAQGHGCGDALLTHFSSILLSALRSSDIVGRLGGDEFGVVLLHAEEKQARATCVRIGGAAEEKPLQWKGTVVSIRFTVGVVQIAGGMDAEAAIAAADAAMYRQKTLRR